MVTVRAFLFRLVPDSIYGNLTFIGVGLFSLRRLQQSPQNGHKSAPEPHREGKKIQLSYEENSFPQTRRDKSLDFEHFPAWVTCAGTAAI